MLRFKINKEKAFPLNVLCLGAHCDDIEIGCGGTILRLISENKDTNINWIVFASNKERAVEAKKSALHPYRAKQQTLPFLKRLKKILSQI